MSEQLPDKLTGKDLIEQENYEFGLERDLVDRMDRVTRRDKRNEIKSMPLSKRYEINYEKIDWTK